jgi:hypothetical protein
VNWLLVLSGLFSRSSNRYTYYVTFGELIIGVLMMGTGFLMVWKQRLFWENAGDLEELFGVPSNSFFRGWLSWSSLGVLLLFTGMFVALGAWRWMLIAILSPFIRPNV